MARRSTFFAAALAALALAAPALADSDYTDSTGEDANAVDITTIHVANDATAGTITFTVNLANLPTLTDDADVGVLIDADQNASTGDPSLGGADYAFDLESGGWNWQKWDPSSSNFVDADANFDVRFANGVLTWKLSDSDIGSVKAFSFFVVTAKGDPNAPAIDIAPDNVPNYNYTLVAAKPTVTSTVATFKGTPKAGRTFGVSSLAVDLSNGTTTKATKLSCTATLGGRAIAGTGAGHCTFKLPKTAKKKRLVVRVTGSYGTTRVVATKSFVVG